MAEKKFPGPIEVSLEVAKKWEKRFNEDTNVDDTKSKVISYLIPRESLEAVLQLNTDAVRAYIGINDENEKTLLFVGANLDKETGQYIDVYGRPEKQDGAKADEEVVYDGSRPSPPY